MQLENEKIDNRKVIQELGEKKKRNFFTKLEEANQKRKGRSGDNSANQESERELTPGIDGTLTNSKENASDQGEKIDEMKRKVGKSKMRAENMLLGEYTLQEVKNLILKRPGNSIISSAWPNQTYFAILPIG